METFLLLVLFALPCLPAAPVDSTSSMVASSPASPLESNKELPTKVVPKAPEIYQMHVISKVANRYAYTTVLSKVRNAATKSQEAIFSIITPERAFISGFIMEIGGKNYTAYVKEKEEAKKTYDAAVASGQAAAHVAVSARDSNRFSVSVNIEPESKAIFYLIYEELLQRQENHYELLINIHPGQLVKDLAAEVTIGESRKIIDIRAPPLRSGNEIASEKPELDPRAAIKVIDDKNVVVTFSPNLERQKELAALLGTDKEHGLSGQFVVQYDVERDPSGGVVLTQDGYFIHFFAPSDLKPLPKHVVFILDTSSSMYGQKIVQLREAMLKILGQLNEQDKFNLVEFNSNVKVWDLHDNGKSVWYPSRSDDYSWSESPKTEDLNFSNVTFPEAYQANADNIKLAKSAVSTLVTDAATDIHTALKVGLYLVECAKKKESKHQPIIIFLTDGEPTVRITSVATIISTITEYNSGSRKAIIFTLSFGEDADKDFLKKIASRNQGFSRHIYEASDAALQLENFYKQISSPLLSNVTFKYEPSTTSLTTTDFPIHFGGSEIVVAGFCGTPDFLPPIIDGWSDRGWIHLKPTIERSVSNIERLWAYLTVKQILDQKESSDKEQEELKKKALDLSLKYQFVTSVSSLVVVKPNVTEHVEPKSAVKAYDISGSGLYTKSATLALSFSALSYDPGADSIDLRIEEPLIEESPIILATTFAPTEVLTNKSVESNILDRFLWLKDILKDGFVSLRKGNFKLGLNETIHDVVVCPKTPLNAAGHCKLLNDCKAAPLLIPNRDVLEEHFCILKNEYAGVCCPDNL